MVLVIIHQKWTRPDLAEDIRPFSDLVQNDKKVILESSSSQAIKTRMKTNRPLST